MNEYRFDIDPCPAPRMTQADRWNKRPIVQRYFAFRNHLRYQANLKSLETLPGILNSLIFHIAMPASWSKSKQDKMRGTPHMQRGDLDNYTKSVLDTLCVDDKHVHTIRNLQKIWADFGSIVLEIEETEAATVADLNYGTDIYRNL